MDFIPGVKGVPVSAAVANYGTVEQYQSGAISNYDGLSVTVRKQLSHSVMAHFNYTWSHALDEISNGGVFAFNNDSLLGQINPLSLRANNYGNADYDIRNNFNADFVYTPTFRSGNAVVKNVLGGWQLSGKIFWRSGLPFSVTDGNTALGNYGGTLLGTYSGTGGVARDELWRWRRNHSMRQRERLRKRRRSEFQQLHVLLQPDAQSILRTALLRFRYEPVPDIQAKERINLSVGMQAFNLFNHPNFNLPDNVLGDPTFGQILSMATTPTSAYGNFLGFDSSPRVVQLTGKIVF